MRNDLTPPSEAPPAPLPKPLGREEEAERDLLSTRFGAGSRILLLASFLAAILLVPAAQLYFERKHHPDELPYPLRVVYLRPHARQLFTPVEQIHDFETELENRSILREKLVPKTQVAMTRYLGVGNHRVFLGRDGYLFFGPDIAALTQAPFFADPAHPNQETNVFGQLDAMRHQLADHGIELVLMPLPMKPQMFPELLASGRYPHSDTAVPISNPSTPVFIAEARRRGFHIYDVGPAMTEAKKVYGEPLWLKTDTHWAQQAVVIAGKGLADYLRSEGLTKRLGPSSVPDGYHLGPAQVVPIPGNMAQMLHIDSTPGTPIPWENVTYRQVLRNGDNQPHDRPASADVLMIGDSYSWMYAVGKNSPDWRGMESGGLSDQLALNLGRPVDAMTILRPHPIYPADLGEIFAEELGKAPGRMGPKKIMVYEFIEPVIGQPWNPNVALHLSGPVPSAAAPRP